MRGEMALEPYITHTFDGIEGVNAAIDSLHSGSCLRAVVHIGKNELPPLRLPTLKANVRVEGGWMKQVSQWRFTYELPAMFFCLCDNANMSSREMGELCF
jgi:hypothetical protein